MTSRALNDTSDLHTGISAKTLVFGVSPKPTGSGPRDTMIERANIIVSCTKKAMQLKT